VVTSIGAGQDIDYVDTQNDLLMVVCWIDHAASLNEFVGKMLAAIS